MKQLTTVEAVELTKPHWHTSREVGWHREQSRDCNRPYKNIIH